MAIPPTLAGRKQLSKVWRWFLLHPHCTLALIVLVALGPFLTKPFNIDDPLFVWVAHQIDAHPGNPYGFDVNWYGITEPMWAVTENPPLASYYLALAAEIFGWTEIALHFAFLLPATATIWGTYHLARRLCRRPFIAVLATLFTPVFLLTGTTLMCDMMMTMFWVWAIVLWIDGMEQDSFGRLIVAGLLMVMALLTKYFGLCLIPLLTAYSLIYQRRAGRWIIPLLIPLMALCIYQLATRMLYGHALFSVAADYTAYTREFSNFPRMITFLTTLTFTGGCFAVVVFFAPLLWRRWVLMTIAIPTICFAAAIFGKGAMLSNLVSFDRLSRAIIEIQIIFWAMGGVFVLALAVGNVWQGRDTGSWLLILWVGGTFLFTAFFNWSVSGRSLLPMAPAVGILLARRLEQHVLVAPKTWWPRSVTLCLVGSLALALLITWVDFLQAVAVRRMAQYVCKQYAYDAQVLWFQGHWGFQYYMDAFGAAALDFEHSTIKSGDNIAIPANNTNIIPPNPKIASGLKILGVVISPSPRFLATMNQKVGASFYSSILGPLPFAFGRVPPENVSVYAIGSFTH